MTAFLQLQAQQPAPGIIAGNIIDEKSKAVRDATVELVPFSDSLKKKTIVSDKDGGFTFTSLGYDHYRLRISYVGFKPLTIDSIHVRADRYDFNLNDIGKTFKVLIEGDSKRSVNDWMGRSTQNKVVVFPKGGYELKKGDYVNVKVVECTRATLIGKIVNSTESRKEKAEII